MPRLFENLFKKRSLGKLFGEGEAGPLGVPYGPIRKILSEWKPMIPERPKVFTQELPPGVTREQAIEVVASTEWAQNLATGWLRAFMPTLTPGTPEYIEAHNRIARRVAEGVLD